MKKILCIFIFIFFLSCRLSPQGIWVPQNSGTNLNLYKNYYTTIVCDNGKLLRRYNYNSGSWILYSTGFNNNLYDYIYPYIIGSNGIILKTNNDTAWYSVPSGTNKNLNSMFGIAGKIYIVGDSGVFIYKANADSLWNIKYISLDNLKDINGYANYLICAGNNGTLLKTTNSGINWQTLTSGTVNNLNCIYHYYNTNDFYVCGNNGTLLKTTNAGINWVQINTGYNYNYKSIYENWMITDDGKILHNISGNIWNVEYTINNPLNHISLPFIMGNNGTILYYDEHYYDTKYIDCNTIRTPFRNNGSFDRDPITENSGFYWPNGSTMTAIYASGLWLGGIVNGDTLVAIAEYDYEFLKGYTDNNGNPQGKLDSTYRVFRLDYEVNNWDRTKWPNSLLGNSDQGAPVYFDNLSNSWKPLDLGSQTMFLVFTDSYPEAHQNRAGSTAPLKADVKMVNFANAGSGPLSSTILSYYQIINRSNSIWNNFYITWWTDADLGNATDDKVGCDTVFQIGYAYNGSNYDGIYGAAPPAVGFLLLKGPIVYTGNTNDTAEYCIGKEKFRKIKYVNKKLSSYNVYFGGDPVIGDPRIYYETYRYMSGFRRTGEVIINPVTNQPTKFVYSGDPVTNQGWIDNKPDDVRFMISCGPINMNPGDTQTIVYAQIIARGTSNLNSITVLRQYANAVRDYYNSCYTNPPIGIEPITNQLPDKFTLYQNYPNPFNPVTKIKFDIPLSPLYERGIGGFISIKIFDILGREVATLVNEQLKPGKYEVEFDGTNYASGIYYYILRARQAGSSTGDYVEIKKMVLLK